MTLTKLLPLPELPIGSHCRVRIRLCASRFSDCLEAVRVDSNRWLVISPDPVWRGAIVNRRDLVIVLKDADV